MDNKKRQSVVPVCAHLSSIEVVGDLEGKDTVKRPDHYVVVSVDDKEVAKSETQPRVPTPRWEWPESHQFHFHPSSTIKIEIYRKSSTGWSIAKHLVGQHTGKIIELLDNNTTIDLKDKTGTGIASQSKIRINLSHVSGPGDTFESFMKIVDANVSRLESTVTTPAGTSILGALGNALQLTKNIMDIVAGAHPILQSSWTVMSAVYTAVQQAGLLDDTVRDLAETLREILGIAKEYPDLLSIEGTTNVIEEIGRTSLRVASLIHEYTRSSFAGRTVKFQLTDTMKSRIAQCQKSCDDLKQKFNTRLNMDTNLQGAKTQGIVTEIKDTIDDNNANIKNTLHTIKDEQLAQQIRHWLSAPDSSKNYNEAREKHEKNTGTWFLDGERFRELQEKTDFLWIKGTAGCGKTILCSSIIEKIIQLHEENTSIAYAYFFFDGRDSQNDLQLHDKLIRSLILQLSSQCDGIPASLVQLYGRGLQQPSTNYLEATLNQIIEGMHLTYLIIDSVDECIERPKTLRWLMQMASNKMGSLRMVVTSRPERDINDVLQQLDPRCIDLAAEVIHDISIYLDQQLSMVKKWDEEMRESVKLRLTERAQGMFRWIALQIMELKKCSNRRAVMTQLDSLPRGLYETYDRILLKIDSETDRTDTKTFLRWLCFSVRPMEVAELAETITVVFDTPDGPRYTPTLQYWDKQDVLDKCAGFIIESEGKVKLAHFSIKEYLLSDHLSMGVTPSFHLTSEELSHSVISQTCLAYLLQFETSDSLAKISKSYYSYPSTLYDTKHRNVPISEFYPLARYAAEHWIFHAHSGGIDNSEPSFILTLAKSLFVQRKAAFTNWVQLWDLDDPYHDVKGRSIDNPLYYASLAGMRQIVLYLVQDSDVNARGGKYGTALQAASYEGHDAIVKLLLEKGADINAQAGDYGNALFAASHQGHYTTVKLLLEGGADINALGGYYGNYFITESSFSAGLREYENGMWATNITANGWEQQGAYGTALQVASVKGHYTIVKLLLKKGASVNAQSGKFGSALHEASFGGYNTTVKLLLENGADVNLQNTDFGTALYVATKEGHDTVVKLLLEYGADTNEQGKRDSTALYEASYNGHDIIVKMLLEKGADVNALGGEYGTPLQAASYKEHDAIVKLLLENGADVNARGGTYSTALQAASYRGHETIVKLLLENGANVNAQGGKYYGTALYEASNNGKDTIVKMLLENGVDVNAVGGEYGTALQAASYSGRDTTVKLLLENGANVNMLGGKYGTALQAASDSYEAHDAIVKLLLEKGADVDARGGPRGTALQVASYEGHDTIVKLLLEHGANVNTQGEGYYGTALYGASDNGHDTIVKMLLEKDVDVNALGGEYGTALQVASYIGRDAIVKLLLGNGADVNVRGGKYDTALQAASAGRHDTTVKLLEENGAMYPWEEVYDLALFFDVSVLG